MRTPAAAPPDRGRPRAATGGAAAIVQPAAPTPADPLGPTGRRLARYPRPPVLGDCRRRPREDRAATASPGAPIARQVVRATVFTPPAGAIAVARCVDPIRRLVAPPIAAVAGARPTGAALTAPGP